MSDKLQLAVIFGGQSPEHDISLISAKHVLQALDREKYDLIPIAIAKCGAWYLQELAEDLDAIESLDINELEENKVAIVCEQNRAQLYNISSGYSLGAIDVAFPILHGPNGEDGTIQGLCRLVNLPFVGCDVLSTAACMDKAIMKSLLVQAGLLTAKGISLNQHNDSTDDAIIAKVSLPCFVKPANMGSSVGISKVDQKEQLQAAINLAFSYDEKIIIEQAIVGKEIELAVLGNDDPQASLPGQIIPKQDFYSYEAKYTDPNGAELVAPASFSDDTIDKLQQTAINAYKALDCSGMARVDLFHTDEGDIYVNELNTIPGFTPISMYPKLWDVSGITYSELMDKLIQLALDRYDKQASLNKQR